MRPVITLIQLISLIQIASASCGFSLGMWNRDSGDKKGEQRTVESLNIANYGSLGYPMSSWTNWYLWVGGKINIEAEDMYSFKIYGDESYQLTIDGTDNIIIEGAGSEKTGSIHLKQGEHAIRLYLQQTDRKGGKNLRLSVEMRKGQSGQYYQIKPYCTSGAQDGGGGSKAGKIVGIVIGVLCCCCCIGCICYKCVCNNDDNSVRTYNHDQELSTPHQGASTSHQGACGGVTNVVTNNINNGVQNTTNNNIVNNNTPVTTNNVVNNYTNQYATTNQHQTNNQFQPQQQYMQAPPPQPQYYQAPPGEYSQAPQGQAPQYQQQY